MHAAMLYTLVLFSASNSVCKLQCDTGVTTRYPVDYLCRPYFKLPSWLGTVPSSVARLEFMNNHEDVCKLIYGTTRCTKQYGLE